MEGSPGDVHLRRTELLEMGQDVRLERAWMAAESEEERISSSHQSGAHGLDQAPALRRADVVRRTTR